MYTSELWSNLLGCVVKVAEIWFSSFRKPLVTPISRVALFLLGRISHTLPPDIWLGKVQTIQSKSLMIDKNQTIIHQSINQTLRVETAAQLLMQKYWLKSKLLVFVLALHLTASRKCHACCGRRCWWPRSWPWGSLPFPGKTWDFPGKRGRRAAWAWSWSTWPSAAAAGGSSRSSWGRSSPTTPKVRNLLWTN